MAALYNVIFICQFHLLIRMIVVWFAYDNTLSINTWSKGSEQSEQHLNAG